jgi:hypothetical protein
MVILVCTLTCPTCSTAKTETMPTDACQFFYECTGCGALLRPTTGDCCVFCSYGSVACPPIQERVRHQELARPFNGGSNNAATEKDRDFHRRLLDVQ